MFTTKKNLLMLRQWIEISPGVTNKESRTRHTVISARGIILGLTASPQTEPSAHLRGYSVPVFSVFARLCPASKVDRVNIPRSLWLVHLKTFLRLYTVLYTYLLRGETCLYGNFLIDVGRWNTDNGLPQAYMCYGWMW